MMESTPTTHFHRLDNKTYILEFEMFAFVTQLKQIPCFLEKVKKEAIDSKKFRKKRKSGEWNGVRPSFRFDQPGEFYQMVF